jgi:signal transduction histidine kinase
VGVSVSSPSCVDLAEFIRTERSEILRRWQDRICAEVQAAAHQDATPLLDYLPALLDTIAETTRTPATAAHAERAETEASRRHAAERLEQGYDLGEVILEYIELRACIFERLDEVGVAAEPKQGRELHRAIDHALRETVRRYVSAHEKMLRAMQHLAGAVPRWELDDVLLDILHALEETAGVEVDSVAIMLLEADGRLHVRATIGLEQEQKEDFSLAVGEGFAGRIAETCSPLLLHEAAASSIVQSPTIRARGTRALYGVPLMDAGHAIGVAYVGSSSAYDFSESDMLLFRAMCERATTAIVRARFVEALERTARFREQFLAVLAHDLRSPLHTILGTVQNLIDEEGAPADQIRARLPRIARSAGRMEQLIAHLLDFTRARLGGGFALRRASFSLLDLAREIADDHAPMLAQRQLTVVGDDVRGSWDRDRLAQVLANLVGNAVQHSPDGSRIRVRVGSRGRHAAWVEVWNDGPPIPPGTKLFEPFARANANPAGLGLGLYIAHEIVMAHGGALTVRSDGAGTAFTVQLPT